MFKWIDTQTCYTTAYNNIKNKFAYLSQMGYEFGQKGAFLKLSAYNYRDRYSLNFNFKIRERLDNFFVCDRYLAFASYFFNNRYVDSGTVSFYRESRTKYVNYFDEDASKNHKYGLQ